MNASAHQEKHLQNYILSKLVEQGWVVGDTLSYDIERALYPEDVESWLKTSGQDKKWETLERRNGVKAREVLMDCLAKELESEGTTQVLRQGFSIAGCGLIEMTGTAPEDKRNEAVIKRYQANILRVVPELKYHPERELAIDLVFFINGIPVATVELKTDFTQSTEAAMEQYRRDRLPVDPGTRRKEPLLTFKRGAVVHFAMSDSEIMMTTNLNGENTFFLPFNKGNDGRAGNPPGEMGADGRQEYPVAYFWKDVCQRDAWLRIFHSFVYVEKKRVADIYGNYSLKETLIFPRFHQWTAVNAIIADARKNGAGMTYLADHSAGSGKTSTISWTAHDLIKLRKDNGDPVFNSVIIVTDRNVLDGQLQEAVKQIDHQFGVIAAITTSTKSKSKRLAEALQAGTPIIVVTIQTFPYALAAILAYRNSKRKNFGVIIDEAHTSQTGASAAVLHTALGIQEKTEKENLTVDELLEQMQKSRVRPDNISCFAFTATPKHSTLMLFGRPEDPTQPASDDNLPKAFHTYTMRQAIEEGFILDVLQGYVPYKTAYHLSKKIEDTERVNGRNARRALAQWMTLHPTNVTQKVEFIVAHFARNVAHLLDGKAKAMVVTSSRAAVIRYKKAFDRYIAQHPEYSFIKSLVAFSDKVTGKEVMHPNDESLSEDIFSIDENAEFTEKNMNPDIQGQDLRLAFDRPEYRVMLVANKFQTGFDQPKLVAMYVDKKIANQVEVVQTFSRLNRMAPGKDTVFIIDFVNDPGSVRAAFALYDSGAQVEEAQDLNIIYEIKKRLDKHFLYERQDLEKFKEARFKTLTALAPSVKAPMHQALYAATDRATRLYNEKMKSLREETEKLEALYKKARTLGDEEGMKSVEQHQEVLGEQIATLLAFKSDLGRFCRTYFYLAQLIDFADPELENFVAFAKLLQKRLLNEPKERVDLQGLLLTGFDIKGRHENTEEPEDENVLSPIGPGGGGRAGDKPVFMQEIIAKLNRIFGEVTPMQDQVAFVNQVSAITSENEIVMAQVKNNTREQAKKGNLNGAVHLAVVRALESHEKMAKHILQLDRQAMPELVDVVYELLRNGTNLEY